MFLLSNVCIFLLLGKNLHFNLAVAKFVTSEKKNHFKGLRRPKHSTHAPIYEVLELIRLYVSELSNWNKEKIINKIFLKHYV